MFERLRKPFLTVETGEAWQPVRLTFHVGDPDRAIRRLERLRCIKKADKPNTWHWYWEAECDDIHFESVSSFQRNLHDPLRLGSISFYEDMLYFQFDSFKRACVAAPFFHRQLGQSVRIQHADFMNHVFGTDEKLPHGFSELFDDNELEAILFEQIQTYQAIQDRHAQAKTPAEASAILSEALSAEGKKSLPGAERYVFVADESEEDADPDVMFLGFYIYLRSRQLVATRRWMGESGYSLTHAMDETLEEVFGEDYSE